MRRLLLVVLALSCSPLLYAQLVEVYGTVNGLHATNVPTSVSSAHGTVSNISFGGGGTLNFFNVGVAKLGIDVRGSNHLALGGLKFAVQPPVFPIKPYIQASIGYLNTPLDGRDNKYAVAEVLAGVDYRLNHFVNYRVLELGEGHAIRSNNGSTPSFFTINTGLVLHF